jgi:hypothetical protein
MSTDQPAKLTVVDSCAESQKETAEREPQRVLPDGPPGRLAPHLVYAIRSTGMVVTERNQHTIAKRRLQKWNRAIDEYFRLTGKAA